MRAFAESVRSQKTLLAELCTRLYSVLQAIKSRAARARSIDLKCNSGGGRRIGPAGKFGDAQDPRRFRMNPAVLTNLIQSLVLLLENGLTLPVALSTLAREPSLKRYAWMLNGICKNLGAGRSLSAALGEYPRTFGPLVISQIRVGERSGSIVETLQRIGQQMQRSGEVRQRIVKRLTYPAMVLLAGTGLIIFMMTVVVPQFESVFEESGTALPLVTRMVSNCSRFVFARGWMVVLGIACGVYVFRRLRRNESFARTTDRWLLKVPVVGSWFRDYAVLQFIDTTGIMMDCGFVPAEAINASIDSISNQSVRQVIVELTAALRRGQKFSDELARHPDMFPPTVSQLVIIGEQTGRMSDATTGVRQRLRQQLESRVDTSVSLIEPFMTLCMAVLIGFIVMAIYMPMFSMMDAME